MKKSEFGIIGLAVMGQNLARNIASRGNKVSVFNRTFSKTNLFLSKHENENLEGYEDLKDFVDSLQKPRKIMLMVKAGIVVDKVIEQLSPLLDKDDIIIDGGNSHFPDTIRREKELAEKNINFFGCGVSGGEEGALHGPSLMPGGKKSVWEDLKPILESIAAKDFDGKPCVTYIGENGAGHYVKMVHNGIEYAVMQMMSEAYQILSKVYELKASEIGDIFEKYNKGKLESFLFEISVEILNKKDDLNSIFPEKNNLGETCSTSPYLLDHILDKAGQKGTGRWTAIDGLTQGGSISVIADAVFARTISSFKDQRVKLSKKYKKPSVTPPNSKNPPKSSFIKEDLNEFIKKLENALYAGMLVAYAQGFDLIKEAEKAYKWEINFSEVARIWEGGCIIRSQILKTLHEAFKSQESSLWEIEAIQKDLENSWEDFRKVVALANISGIPVFCLGTALSSLEAMTDGRGSANFIQGLRDNFGAHTYERTCLKGTFHTDWDEK